jgi:peptidoglycan/LPS O-acetylase OafA/YrhL
MRMSAGACTGAKMRSSTGQHWIALDHVRAVAAFLVFMWHFIHGHNGVPVSFDGAPWAFPLAILDEGHTGVSLFMALSGYLFAKLLDGKDIDYPAFLWTRVLRLAPLFFVFYAVSAVPSMMDGRSLGDVIKILFAGLILPVWPSGSWSIAIELQFYVLLPFLLAWTRKRPMMFAVFIIIAIAFRYGLHARLGEIQNLSYQTLVGRIDQFLFGMVAFGLRHYCVGRHGLVAMLAVAYAAFYWWFDQIGGFYRLGGTHPSPSALWVVLPTIEGAAYGTFIAYYDSNFRPGPAGFSGLIARAGTYSYSIYLLHLLFVIKLSVFIHRTVIDMSNFYVAIAVGSVAFATTVPLGYLSYRFIEQPFLKLRRPYAVRRAALTPLL